MSAHFATAGLYGDRLPEARRTALRLAGEALRTKRLFRELASANISDAQWNSLDRAEMAAAEAFFAALERETGIDRALFRDLGELA